jgi:hypothetical protein
MAGIRGGREGVPMTGNKFAGETCVYCCTEPSTTDDHVFARKFFLETQRDRLPQVPACSRCNGSKSELESELMTTAPLGGRHVDAEENLARLAAPRVAKNLRLRRRLAQGQARLWSAEADIYRRTMSVPFDWEKVEALCVYLAKGLVWHHWKARLGTDCFVEAHVLFGPVHRMFRAMQQLNARDRVLESLGKGTFSYWGLQGVDNPQITVWEFTIYGGLVSEHGVGARQPNVGVMTGPARVQETAERTADLLSKWRRGVRLLG